MKNKNVSIIIPAYKPSKKLLNRLTKYLKENKTKSTEILIVDGRDGLANAYNKGIKKSKGEIIITIHADCVPLEKNALVKLLEPFKEKKVVLSYAWVMEEDIKKKYYPDAPDGKLNAFRRKALYKVGLFDEKTFFTGGEDVDIWLKLKKIGKIVRVNAGVLHTHKNYRGNITTEKRKQNGGINGVLFRIWGFKNPKWFKALIMCGICPKDYGKNFIRAFIQKRQDYRRGE